MNKVTQETLDRIKQREEIEELKTNEEPEVTVCKDYDPGMVQKQKGVKNKHFTHDNKYNSLSSLSYQVRDQSEITDPRED